MAWTTLISVDELATRIDDCVVIDCRHELTDPTAGPAAYSRGHIPGARFLHQDHELAGPTTGPNAPPPLPPRDAPPQPPRARALPPRTPPGAPHSPR